jgi:enoyl-CoA hydratase/carnithine racemase/predicted thioesterase
MRSGLTIGAEAELVWQVAAEHTIHLGFPPPSLVGSRLAEYVADPSVSAVVFSTPFMILLMERAARKVIEPFLDSGEASVGASVNIDHMAGTPLGEIVRGVARVTAISGRTIDFEVAAYDRHEQIGRGVHRRAVVKLERVAKKMAEKSAAPQSHMPLSWMDGIANLPAASPGSYPSPVDLLMPKTTNLTPSSSMEPLPVTRTLEVDVSGSLAIVKLNRPAKKNAVNFEMTEDWERINGYLSRHPQIRIVIVTGSGDAFCAGDDVPEVGTLSIEKAQELSYRQARMYLAWEQLPQIFLGAINGSALGGGCVAASACDLRIASHNATFGMPEVLLGWPPGYGIAQLTALIGKGRAMEMCLTGKPINAQTALQYGLVQRLSPAGMLLAHAKNWADELLAMPPEALRSTKQLIHADEGLQPKTAFLADTAAYIRCLQGADAKEGIAAFKEKRKPKFSK